MKLEFFQRLAKNMKKSKRICPKCKSKNISADLSASSFAKGSVFNQFKCNNCGYIGIFYPEVKNSQ